MSREEFRTGGDLLTVAICETLSNYGLYLEINDGRIVNVVTEREEGECNADNCRKDGKWKDKHSKRTHK